MPLKFDNTKDNILNYKWLQILSEFLDKIIIENTNNIPHIKHCTL